MITAYSRNNIFLRIGCLFIILLFFRTDTYAEKKKAQVEITFHILLKEKKCQMAIWLVDEKGIFVDTIYVTKKIAQKGLGNRGGEMDDKWGGSRLSALPVWAYQRGKDYGGGNFYPPKDRALPDTITSATPKAGEFTWNWRPEKNILPGKYRYYVEVNKSFDKNKDHDYSWYRGQPSVIWQGEILVRDKMSENNAKIIGHGHIAGANGKINPDLSTLTTALQLIEKVEAVYRPLTN